MKISLGKVKLVGIVRMGPPIDLVLKLKEAYGVECFVETGTYHARTALWASRYFNRVVTIERSQELYALACKMWGYVSNIDFLEGDTRDHLGRVLSRLDRPCLLWLDAHWSGGNTYGVRDECPLLEELQLIQGLDMEHFILIDDARLFLAPPPLPHNPDQWPSIEAIVAALCSNGTERYIAVIEDVLISVPKFAKTIVVEYCQSLKPTNHQFTLAQASDNEQMGTDERCQKLSNLLADNGEAKVIEKFIHQGQVIFDVGANVGKWTQTVLSHYPNVCMHIFEPVPQTYLYLLKCLTDAIKQGSAVPNCLALGASEGIVEIQHYVSASAWSTLHRRHQVERSYGLTPPQSIPILSTTLDRYCERQGVDRIHFLKIDVEGSELDVLRGAERLLQSGSIDYLQFEYGGTFQDAGVTLREVFAYLQRFRYAIFKIAPNGLEYKPAFSPEYEDFQYANFLAVEERLRSKVLGEPPQMLDLPKLCWQHAIQPRGVIHVGAHEGKEVATYQRMGVERMLFVEANPAVCDRLKANLAGVPNVCIANCAISNQDGTVELHVTSMDQSSSILPLKRHQDIYPTVRETHKVQVLSRTLDSLLQQAKLKPEDFNLLNLDIQGAELLALKGASNLLRHVEAINTEVNYEELYEGCAIAHQIDEFLEQHGFERVVAIAPYHPSWGDAFYVRKPVITMSTLGTNGRFANQLFQYAFLKIYAKEHNLRVETPAWIGQYLFGHQDPPISRNLPEIKEQTNQLSEAAIPNSEKPFKNVDFWGYFQYNTRYYAPYKKYFRSLFKPTLQVEATLKTALAKLRAMGKTIVGLHLRRGDYGYEHFFIAPSIWYIHWLKGLWETLDNPVLFIASDEPEKILEDFKEYRPVLSRDLGAILPSATFYPDFYLLSQCDVVAISNSSFSFAACMLNEIGKFFFRPHLQTQKFIPFDPWSSEVILRSASDEKATYEEERETFCYIFF